MINNDPNSRPKTKEIIILLTEYLTQHEKQNELSNGKISSPLKKRKRFLSQDISKAKAHKLLMQLNEGNGHIAWKNVWIKVINDKILVFSQKESNKAMLSYDIKECEIKGKMVEEENEREDYGRRSKVSSSYLPRPFGHKAPAKRKSLSCTNVNEKIRSKYENIDLIRQLNYVIEIDHPYLQKCFIKSKNLIDSMDFYNHILSI